MIPDWAQVVKWRVDVQRMESMDEHGDVFGIAFASNGLKDVRFFVELTNDGKLTAKKWTEKDGMVVLDSDEARKLWLMACASVVTS